ncbi:MAG: hypothetical protein M4579_003649 [Chaenotheca gracillima]|nr:MAG: hypothetical protein M4579_003649 [Chaenotheca gracillima]
MLAYYAYRKRQKAKAAKAAQAPQGTEAPEGAQARRAPPTRKLCEHQRRMVPVPTTVWHEESQVQSGQDGISQVEPASKTQLRDADEPEKTRVSTTATNPEATPSPPLGPCQICKADKRRATKYRWKLIAGLFFPYLIASLDLTITATALPFIASHFNKFDQLNWIVTAFTLTSTSFIPAFGQLSDVFGRHAVLQLAMVFQLVGCALCVGAPTWGVLLLGRAIQGVSAAGIMNLIKIILSDKVSLKENATNTTIFGWVNGIGFSIGPIIGGYLTTANWRYCFVLPMPLAAAAMVVIYFLLRPELVGPIVTEETSHRRSFLAKIAIVDYGGLLLFLFGVALIILATSWGGATYPWNSVQVLAPLVIGAVLFVSFFFYEYLMEPGRMMSNFFPKQTPMIPINLFKKRDLKYLVFVNFATGASMYSIFYFVGIYFVLVKDFPSDQAGIQLLYYIPGIAVGVQGAILFSNFLFRQTFISLWLGSLLECVGIAFLILALHNEKTSVIAGMMGLAGAGTGFRLMPATLHVAGIWPTKIAAAMSIQDFAMPFGGTIALAIMGSVFNNKMGSALPMNSMSNSGGGSVSFNSGGSNTEIASLNNLPPAQKQAVQNSARDAVVWSFISLLPILALSVVAASFLGNVRITKRSATERGQEKGGADGETSMEVSERPFLLELVRGRSTFNGRDKPTPSKTEAV